MADPTPPSDLKSRRALDNTVLAFLRTELANRRTLLAYVKTALGVAIAGFGLMQFADADSVFVWVGMAVLPLSVLILVYGIIDYIHIRRRIEQEKRDARV
ncbi:MULTISPECIES: DUF202 domain-containing protein [unclassified Ruegeria]|uniref:DUF202 domain-containing protein n=1 Tax=unclassified Ruegeria TaxID=2625375 RepID=UPI0014880026|nr:MULTISPECIES: DUF202 domain-containing protein [unclassified Ruegeria]NOD76958.1 DUF202 domain-containing protein [Ruegeria sp. HKCCD4332]NOD88481.1 DUF202 domain-containing protein [Ruegeria sp. HKCCD4318]NOD94697.1 DUF202 domain-containing protein [Ruegeria sp. HKCCD4884]NOE13390.1 DUF202 domain-containing protein [Ruegeria sp. HKCCD4318-2]NOG11068.1 DUF202 domain-containing protein [Ruegeria sp. HKCCD4315]